MKNLTRVLAPRERVLRRGKIACVMRLDLFLKHTGLVKRRAIAKEMCDGGKVSQGDKKAAPADEVHLGDVLQINYGARRVELKVLDIPRGQIPKEKREHYFQVLSETKTDDDW